MTNSELEKCILEYGKDIYAFCRHITCSRQAADDLYQDTFLKAIELSSRIDEAGNLKSYLISVAIRIWKNRKRKYAWRKRIADTQVFTEEQGMELEGETPTPEEQIISREESRLVRDAVDRLPDKIKIPVLLYYMEELSVSQIADLLKIPEGTVKSRLYQARKKLEKELEDVLDEKRSR